MYFTATWLEWEQFRQLWWLGPWLLVFEWLFWEFATNIIHVNTGRRLVSDSKAYGKRRNLRERLTAGVIYAYLDSF